MPAENLVNSLESKNPLNSKREGNLRLSVLVSIGRMYEEGSPDLLSIAPVSRKRWN